MWRKSFKTSVSIPSKRESAFQVYQHHRSNDRSVDSFNSLQTGKRISRTPEPWTSRLRAMPRFNSLQTGKRISSETGWRHLRHRRSSVSIPSKRESAFQAFNSLGLMIVVIFTFQFPPNGKAHFKPNGKCYRPYRIPVSIPSKRESAFQG